MDKELLSYLADIAAVRNHLNTLLSVGRGVIDQKTLHQVSARSASLDKLFVQSFLSGRAPGSTGGSPVVVEDDYADIQQRLREEKAKLSGQPVPQPAPQPQQLSPAEQALLEDEEEDDDDDIFPPPSENFSKPDDEVAEVEKLLAQAEAAASGKKVSSKKAPAKRGRPRKKTTE